MMAANFNPQSFKAIALKVSWKRRIEDRGSGIGDRGSGIEDRGSRIGDRGSGIENLERQDRGKK